MVRLLSATEVDGDAEGECTPPPTLTAAREMDLRVGPFPVPSDPVWKTQRFPKAATKRSFHCD